jgi:hypothetical protein
MKKEAYTHIIMAAIAVAIIGAVFASVALSQHQSKTTTSSIQQQNITNITLGANTVELPGNTIIQNFTLITPICPPPPGGPWFSNKIINISVSNNIKIYNTTLRAVGTIRNYVSSNSSTINLNYIVYRNQNTVEIINNHLNGTKTYVDITNTNDINTSNFVVFYKLVNSSNSNLTTLGAAGLHVYLTPGSEITVPSQTSYLVRVNILISTNASKSTYAVVIGPAFAIAPFCTSTFLLTIGSKPYNETANVVTPA